MNCSKPFHQSKKLITTLFLFIFILFFLIQNYLFIQQDRHTVFTDSHLTHATVFYDRLILKNDNSISHAGYPPLLYLLTTLAFRINGISVQVARMVISLFSVIFLLAMFGIGYQMGGYHSGAAVMALAASSPHLLNYSRHYFPAFPQTALTALAFCLLLKSEGYKHRSVSILMGIAMALSFLVKWSTAFFLIIPVLWFFIPIIMKPGKYLNQYIVFLIASIFTIIGTFYYIKSNSMPVMNPQFRWLKYYILFVILPSIFCITTMFLAERRSKYDDGYSSSSFRKLFNFSLMGTVFNVIALPWYYWNASGIANKFQAITEDFIKLQDKAGYLGDFIRTSFSFFPIFLILSVIGFFMTFFMYKKNLFRNLILPVNIIFILLLMTKIMCPGSRYLLSIIIFTSALGGFWVTRVGKFKWILTAFILVISLISIMSWMIFPSIPSKTLPIKTVIMEVGDFSIFPATNSLVFIQSQPVIINNAQNEVKPVIDYLFTATTTPCNRIMIIDMGAFRGDKFESEFLAFEIFRLTGKLQDDFGWNWNDFKRFTINDGYSQYPAFESDDFNDSIIDRINDERIAVNNTITRHFSEETRVLLRDKNPSVTKSSLKKKVVKEFNRLLSSTKLSKESNVAQYLQKIEPVYLDRQKNGNPVFLNRRVIENIYETDIRKKFRRDFRLETACSTVDCIAILYACASPAPVVEEMKRLFPGQIYDSKTYDLGRLYHIKVMKINRLGVD